MKARLVWLAGALALGFSQISAAQDTGWYVGATVGQSQVQDLCDDFSGPGVSCDDKDPAWRILGGYQFTRFLAVELGYHDLGKIQASGPGGTASRKANAWEILGVGSLPLGPVSIYGKLGAYRGETKGVANTVLLSGDVTETNTDVTYGAGVRFDLTRNIGLRGEWQRYPSTGDDDTTGKADIDVLSLGLLWRF